MRRLVLSSAVALALAAGASEPSLAAPALPSEYLGRPLAWLPKLAAPAKLTADLSAPEWKSAARLALGDAVTGAKALHETTAFLFATDAALYVGVRCAEPRPDSLVTAGVFWERDEVEIFFEPLAETLKKPYHQIEIDAAGNVLCYRGHVYRRWLEERALEERWTPKIEVATSKDGAGWSVAARIPFDQLVMSDEARAKRTAWRLQVARVRADRPGDPGSLCIWSPPGAVGTQWPTKFGYALVEPFASQELIDAVKRAPPAPGDPSVARAGDPAVLAEIDQALEGVLSPDAAAREKSLERLKAFSQEGVALCDVLQTKANAATTKARADRNPQRWYLRDVAEYRLRRWRPDDDPPPDSLLAKFALFEPRQFTGADGQTLNYRLLKPKDYDPAKSYPLLVWLHGGTQIGTDNFRQLTGGAWGYLADNVRAKYPSFVLAPQCPPGGGWVDITSNPDSQAVLAATSNYRLAEKPSWVTQALLDAIASLWREFPSIDRRRLYVAGGSGGGYGTWELVMRRPEWFAAAMPLAGGGDETRAALITKVPVWIFHGEKDAAVKVTAARNMFEALKKAGGSPKYTEIPGAPHDINSPNLWPESLDWLFSQKRDTPARDGETADPHTQGAPMPAPKGVICQSCAMPMSEPKHFGTEADGSAAKEYCCFCYQRGAFTADLTREQMIDKLIGFAPQMGQTRAEARAMANDVIPKLKRWRAAK